MDFRILGPLEVAQNGRHLKLGGAKQRSVLALLLLHANEPVSVDRLVDQIYGEQPPSSAVQTVRVHVSRLRKSLANGGEAAPLLTGPSGYQLQVGPGQLDLDRFEQLVAEGRRALAAGKSERAGALLREGLALWRGPPLADLAYEPFAQAETSRLEELRLAALEDRLDADLALGRHAEVVPELDALVAKHPLRERLRRQHMLALYRSGRQAEALEEYLRARRVSVEEAGAEPGPELRRLHEAILRQDPELAPPVISPAPEPEPLTGPRRRSLRVVAAAAVLASLVIATLLVIRGEDEPVAGIPGNTVGRIDQDTGAVSDRVQVGRGPRLAVTGAGSVWVANALDRTVSRIDLGDRQVTTLETGTTPTGLAFGEGSLWVATAESRSVSEIDPRTNRVVQSIEVGNAPGDVAVGFGSVWASATVDGEVVQIDLARGEVVRRIPVGSGPTSLAAGAGAIWVAGEATGTVERIEPSSGRVVDAAAVGNAPSDIEVGGGAVWVSNRTDGTLSRIDPQSVSVTETVRVGSEPSAVAADDTAVWVANSGAGTVVHVDPRSRRLVDTIKVGSSPSALTVAAGSVWTATLPSPGSHRGGTLRARWQRPEPSCHCTDPVEYLEPLAARMIGLAYDGLVAYRRTGGSAGATLVPNLARDLPEPSDGGRSYVFQLRPGVRYSDGRPVRAEDFRHSMERLLRLNGRVIPETYRLIVGARACVERPASCDLSAGVATDARSGTIRIRLARPDPDFIHALASTWASVVPSDTPTSFLRNPAPGTGPYRIVRWDNRRGGRLVRNPRFKLWSREARPNGFADAIDITLSDGARADVEAVGGDDLDVTTVAGPFGEGLSPAGVRVVATRYAGRLIGSPQPELDYMWLNTRRPPFDNPQARRAIDRAVDRRRLADLAGGPELAQLTCQFLPPSLPGYRPYCPQTLGATAAGSWIAPDLVRARRLVRQSGTKGMRVSVWTWGERARLARYVTVALQRIGYQASLRVFADGGEYYTRISSGGPLPDVGYNGWYADQLTPANFVTPNFGCAAGPPSNFSGFCDRAIDARVNRALDAQLSDPEAANRIWERVDRELVAAAPALPLFNRRGAILVSKRVENVQWHPLWGPLLDQMWVR